MGNVTIWCDRSDRSSQLVHYARHRQSVFQASILSNTLYLEQSHQMAPLDPAGRGRA